MRSIHFLSLSLLLFLPLTAVADEKKTKSANTLNTFDARREDINKTYLEKLAALRKQYEADFLALQQIEAAALKARQETAMKALNLDQANQLNAEIQRVQSQTSASQLRSLFVRNTSRGERAYFIRCPDGEWIERVVSRRSSMAYSYRLTAETPEYIELTHESGSSTHRLYDDRDMFRDEKKVKDGQVITTNGQTMPQRWVLVQPGHVITVNNRIIDSLTIDLEAGTLQSNAFSEDTPKASWTTKRIVAAP